MYTSVAMGTGGCMDVFVAQATTNQFQASAANPFAEFAGGQLFFQKQIESGPK